VRKRTYSAKGWLGGGSYDGSSIMVPMSVIRPAASTLLNVCGGRRPWVVCWVAFGYVLRVRRGNLQREAAAFDRSVIRRGSSPGSVTIVGGASDD
jgi:hypothetical protein